LLTRIESAIKATNGVLRLRLATQSVSMARLLNRIRRSLWLIAGAGFTLLLIDIILDHGGIF
jgi:translation initiation factor IF-1